LQVPPSVAELIGISEGWGPSLEKIDILALSFAACPKLNIIDIN
jgi:hypothetical protein